MWFECGRGLNTVIVCTAVEAALRGDETPLPLRGESISIGPLNSFPPRPPVPHHTSSSSSSTANGRQGSPSMLHATDRPPPVGRVSSRGEVAPPLPNRVTPSGATSPKSRDVPPTPSFHTSPLPTQPPRVREVPPTPPSHFHSKEGPPLPNRGSLRNTRPSLPSVPSHGHGGGARNPPVPPVASHPSPGGRGKPTIPPPVASHPSSGGGGGGKPIPPPMNRSGSRPQIPEKPKPALPHRPAAIPRKPQAPAKVGGTGGAPASPVSIPSPDNLTPHEMVDFFLTESPAMIAAVQSGSGNIPRMLDELVVLGEAITDQAKGSKVQFRIRITQFRNGLGKLKTFSNITWYNCIGQIVEELEKLVASLEVIQQNMIG